ncbi:Tubulin alpha chain [Paragonimus heterotremus]|uniref:Tubulin alpha chain n=1 Tax=Paragonimus heterotremus TaxID=100268 RepID=A0A8J4SPN6_9TREM|nr:Tubulin alpha chain [Paragonimus heterotremus]
MGGQIIQCFLGQCGLQVGNAVWELACVENGLDPSGVKLNPDTADVDSGIDTAFSQTRSGRYVPRCTLIDTEPTVIDEVRVGVYRNLFNPQQLVNGWEDSASNFARGYYQNARKLMQPSMNAVRQLTEACDNLQAFTFHHSNGGGTGSGFTAALLEKIRDEYAKRVCFGLTLCPSDSLTNSTVEAYNSLLGFYVPTDYIDFSILLDNQALLKACVDKIGIPRPTMTHLNRIHAQVMSGLLSPLQFDSQLSANVSALLTNLVPYPSAHFLVSSMSPLRGYAVTDYEANSCYTLTQQAFEADRQLLTCPADHRTVYLSCCLFYRGGVSGKQVNSSILHLKQSGRLPWVDWCPTGFKVAISHQPITCIPGSYLNPASCSLVMLHNSTMIVPSLSRLLSEFQLLYSRRAFIHWFAAEGMDESQFSETLSKLTQLRDEYIQFQQSDSTGHHSNEISYRSQAPSKMKNYSASPYQLPSNESFVDSCPNITFRNTFSSQTLPVLMGRQNTAFSQASLNLTGYPRCPTCTGMFDSVQYPYTSGEFSEKQEGILTQPTDPLDPTSGLHLNSLTDCCWATELGDNLSHDTWQVKNIKSTSSMMTSTRAHKEKSTVGHQVGLTTEPLLQSPRKLHTCFPHSIVSHPCREESTSVSTQKMCQGQPPNVTPILRNQQNTVTNLDEHAPNMVRRKSCKVHGHRRTCTTGSSCIVQASD